MFQETLIRAEAEYRMARAQEAAGSTRRHRFGGPRSATPPSSGDLLPSSDPSRLAPSVVPAVESSTIDDGSSSRSREPVAV